MTFKTEVFCGPDRLVYEFDERVVEDCPMPRWASEAQQFFFQRGFTLVRIEHYLPGVDTPNEWIATGFLDKKTVVVRFKGVPRGQAR